MSAVWLQEKSCKEVETYLESDTRILIPVGSTEQHGVFAPTGTDTYAAMSIAESASAATGVLIAPPLWYGWSPHHLARAGTVSIRAEILLEVLFDMIQSLAQNGFKNFVVINGHRVVNLAWMQIAAERAQRQLNVRVMLFDLAYMSKEIARKLDFEPLGHGEEIEISHMLFQHPDLVTLEQAQDFTMDAMPLYHTDPSDPRDTLGYVPATKASLAKIYRQTGDTIFGHPTRASAEKGRAYHEHLAGRLTEVLDHLAS